MVKNSHERGGVLMVDNFSLYLSSYSADDG